MYVCINLLTVMATEGYSVRNRAFWLNCKFLMKNALMLGIYTYTDYEKTPVRFANKYFTSCLLTKEDVSSVSDERLVEASRRDFAARRIQRAWDTCLSDPTHAVGKQRLEKEFKEMMEFGSVIEERYSYHKKTCKRIDDIYFAAGIEKEGRI